MKEILSEAGTACSEYELLKYQWVNLEVFLQTQEH